MSRPRRKTRDTGPPGFTLVEILVALVIAAIGLQLAFEMMSGHARLLEGGVRERRAAELADSLLARVGTEITVQPGASSGSFDNAYHWHLQVTLMPRAAPDLHPVVVAYDVVVEVLWSGWLHEQSVRLHTLKLAPPPANQ
jgi:prepilin-type N-terminal cleavage/methylation domain-containing protein